MRIGSTSTFVNCTGSAAGDQGNDEPYGLIAGVRRHPGRDQLAQPSPDGQPERENQRLKASLTFPAGLPQASRDPIALALSLLAPVAGGAAQRCLTQPLTACALSLIFLPRLIVVHRPAQPSPGQTIDLSARRP
ncbi:hypothetical protein AB0J35_25915 [Nonomuraea angiospora]|jgi:hypothetical protein|uniref:hypothetical protein n=1 Tax=Nonomuraea angiospora TaxID=46172 RepID=UPI003426F17D